jgi:hypothetical protein
MQPTNPTEPNMTNSNLVDRAVVLSQDIKSLNEEYAIVKENLINLGLGKHEGVLGDANVRKNKDSEIFDAAAAFEYIADQLSPQLLAAVRRKFTSTREGAYVVTPKAKVVKIIAADATVI